jgi:hypothetical protein
MVVVAMLSAVVVGRDDAMSTKGLPELLFQIEDQLLQPLFGDGISRFHHRQASLCKASFQFLPVISFGHFGPLLIWLAREHGYGCERAAAVSFAGHGSKALWRGFHPDPAWHQARLMRGSLNSS